MTGLFWPTMSNALRVGLGIVSVVMGLTLLLFSIFAPLTSAFKRSLGYYSVASILFAVLQMQEEMQLTVLFGHYHVWCLFTYPVMVLLPFLLIMTINAQLEQALNERKSELYAAAKQD